METSTPLAVAELPCESGGCITMDIYDGEHLAEPVIRFHASETGTVMQARLGEVAELFAQIKNGDWDHIFTDYEFAAARQRADARGGARTETPVASTTD